MLEQIVVSELARARWTLDGAAAGGDGANRLLAALLMADPAAARACLPAPRPVAPGTVLFEPGQPPAEALFPSAGTVLSLRYAAPGRKPVEAAAVGCEGAAGALHGPAAGPAFLRCVALTGGAVVPVPAARLGEALDASPALRRVMARYAEALAAQAQHAAAAAALHPVEARTAGWMLALQDRIGDRALPVTQEALADLLGVRRTTITRVVGALEERGLVRHRRGRIVVVDRPGLEAAAGDAYGPVPAQFERLAPGLYRAAPRRAEAGLTPAAGTA